MRASILTALALVAVLVVLFPFYWAVSLSVRPPLLTFAVSGFAIPWVDFTPTLEAWRGVFGYDRYRSSLANSTVIGSLATVMAMAIGVPCAYALARGTARLASDGLVIGFLLIRLLPPMVFVVPFYLTMEYFGLLDTRTSLVLVNTTLLIPLVVVIMRQAFLDVPRELEEAAALDGAGTWLTFLMVDLPLTLPAIAASALILFAFAWNDYVFALAFFVLEMHTMPMEAWSSGLSPHAAAVALLALSVPMALALLAQRYIVRGLTLGAVKG